MARQVTISMKLTGSFNMFKESFNCKMGMRGTVKCRPTVAYRLQFDCIIISN